MCEVALRRALEQSGLEGSDLDALFVVTCSPDRPSFNHDAMALHQRVALRASGTFAMVIDDGCGGTPYVMDMARRMLEGGAFRTIAVVASSFTSPYVNREVFTAELKLASGKQLNGALSMYVFGDGASAVILRAEEEEGVSRIVSSVSGNAHDELVIHRAGGALNLPFQGNTAPADHAFIVDGVRVARTYPVFMRRCIEEVTGNDPAVLAAVKRFYFHQPNRRLMDRFIEDLGLPPDRVACHVDRYGNTSAAGMMTLLAEDLAEGVVRLGSGDLVLVAAVGANVHYGAQLVRL
jgi:3-oxoacyl-[acyl-carrier-protein] synthase III